jgi:uncharacterized phage-like protein YoqJ
MMICCVTGHRELPIGRHEYVKEELRREILLAINNGYTHFISGMAKGVDIYFASIVAELKAKYSNITLEAAIPHRKRLDTKDKAFQRLIALCDTVHVTAEKYGNGAYMKRNMYMVDKSGRVIAVYDGRLHGGTEFTIRYARIREKELNIIAVEK